MDESMSHEFDSAAEHEFCDSCGEPSESDAHKHDDSNCTICRSDAADYGSFTPDDHAREPIA